ncbi:MAG: APC family permease [Thermoanaerobaculia bacterium]
MSEAPATLAPPSLRVVQERPRPLLSVVDGVALVIGVVIGAAVFETPALVAGSVGSTSGILLVWALGGVISVLGAFCYAELASAWPDAGGDYHFLTKAWGGAAGFLYAWARIAVIQTGSIALIAFVFGDYASQILRLGPQSAAIWAAIVVVALTLLHLAGLKLSSQGQRWFVAAQLIGLAVLIAGGLLFAPAAPDPGELAAPVKPAAFGLAMVFVLLTYGGWNEAAFVSAELRDAKRDVIRVLLVSIGIIAAIYLLLNLAMIRALGVVGMSSSGAVGADLMRQVAGERGATAVSLLVVAAALASINAMIFTGARSAYALGRDFRIFSAMGEWRRAGSVPANALMIQGAIILALIGFGAAGRNGFESMVEYTAPVFWLFFLLTTLSLIRLRRVEPDRPRPFTVPLYPVTPLLFAAICGYLLYSSIAYTGAGALVGLAVLALGLPLLWICRRRIQSS